MHYRPPLEDGIPSKKRSESHPRACQRSSRSRLPLLSLYHVTAARDVNEKYHDSAQVQLFLILRLMLILILTLDASALSRLSPFVGLPDSSTPS